MTPLTMTAHRPGRTAASSLAPLVLDVGVPLAGYYLLTGVFGMGTVAALALSSVVPAARTVWGLLRDRRANALAMLMLVVNAVGLALSLLTGDPRLMLAKDSGLTATIGIAILLSVLAGKPLMNAALKPWIVKGDAARSAAWDRLAGTSAAFRGAGRTFSTVWGIALVTEGAARVVGAYTLPVDTMVWAGPVLLIATIFGAMRVCVPLAAEPIAHLVAAEANQAV